MDELAVASAPQFDEGEEVAYAPSPAAIAHFHLRWDCAADADLDLSAVLFNRDGVATDAAYFHRERAAGDAVVHAGDQQDGRAGESITVYLDALDVTDTVVVAVVVTSYNEARTLSSVRGCMLETVLPGQPALVTPLSTVHASCGLGTCVSRRDGQWSVAQLAKEVPNCPSFVDALPELRRQLGFPLHVPARFAVPVVLEKSEAITLYASKDLGPLMVGVGWDIVGGQELDVDVSCVLLDANGDVQGTVFWGQLSAFGGAVTHSGDNLTGEGEGDDEAIYLSLHALPPNVTGVGIVVNNHGEGDLTQVANIVCRLVRVQEEREIAQLPLIGAGGNYSGLIAFTLTRDGDAADSPQRWRLDVAATPCQGKTFNDPSVQNTLRGLLVDKASRQAKPINFRKLMKRERTNRSTQKPQAAKKEPPQAAPVRTGSTEARMPLWVLAILACFMYVALFRG